MLEEFLVEVEKGNSLDLAHRHGLRAFLLQCDLVKFARLLPQPSVHEETFKTAEIFIEATREDRTESGQLREGAA